MRRSARRCISVFLFHAIKAGMDMGIVNAGQLTVYQDIPTPCARASRMCCSTAASDATERLLNPGAGISRRRHDRGGGGRRLAHRCR